MPGKLHVFAWLFRIVRDRWGNMVFMLVFFIMVCIILITYIICIKMQLGSIRKQLHQRRKEEASNPVLIEIRDKSLVLMTAELNKTLRSETALRVSQEIKEHEFKQLITNISHDIRTPLAVMKGYLQLLQKSGFNDNSREYLEICISHTDRMEKRIQQFFEYSYWSGMDEEIILQRVNITNLVTEVMTDFIPVFEKNNIRMKLDNTKVYFGMADKEMLLRIMQNLLKNSLQYAAGDVEVSILKPDNNQFLQVQVSNPVKEGYSLDASKVFNRFYVGNEERNHSTGLGLSIVKLLVERMGGEVFARMDGELFCTGFMLPSAG